jgi:hypothetical protein
MQSHPGAGPVSQTAYTRDIKVVLGGQEYDRWEDAQNVNEGCKFHSERFLLSEKHSEVTITSENSLTGRIADGNPDNCFFNHRFAVAMADFRDTTKLSFCGFNRTVETVNMGGNTMASFDVLSGRIHLRWSDFDSMDSRAPVRPPTSTFYPISIRVQRDLVVASSSASTSATTSRAQSATPIVAGTSISASASASATASASRTTSMGPAIQPVPTMLPADACKCRDDFEILFFFN